MSLFKSLQMSARQIQYSHIFSDERLFRGPVATLVKNLQSVIGKDDYVGLNLTWQLHDTQLSTTLTNTHCDCVLSSASEKKELLFDEASLTKAETITERDARVSLAYFSTSFPVYAVAPPRALLCLPSPDALGIYGSFQRRLPRTCWARRTRQGVGKKWSIADAIRCNLPEAETKVTKSSLSYPKPSQKVATWN